MANKKQKKILKTANKMFGYPSIEQICMERKILFKKIYDCVNSKDSKISNVEFLRIYSKYVTLDKLYRMYMQEEKHGRK